MGVSSQIIVPFVGMSFDNSKAVQGPAVLPVQAALVGQKITAGTATAGVAYLVTSADQVRTLAGIGSHLHRLAIKWFGSNKFTPTYIVALADATGSAAGTYSIPITGTATAAGELPLYIDGVRFSASVAAADTAAVVAQRIADAITADTTMAVTAVNTTGTIVLTAKNKGVTAGDVGVSVCFYPGESVPAGLTVGATVTTPGTGEPDVTSALSAFGDLWFNLIVSTYSDDTNLAKVEKYLEDNAAAEIMHDGVYYIAKKDTLTNLVTFGTNTSRNCPWVVCIGGTGTPESVANIAAAYAAAVAASISDDPAKPLHRMVLDLIPAQPSNRFTMSERNQLAKNGIATLRHDNGVQTDATVTMYLRNIAGAADTSYQYQNDMFNLMNLRYTFVNRILSRYGRSKLAASADRVEAGEEIITPDIGRAEAISWFLDMEAKGQVQNLKQFKSDLVCRISTTVRNRLEWLLPPTLMGQFIVGSADLQFRV